MPLLPKPHPLHILRVFTAVTFIWIGVLILKDPEGWGAMIKGWVGSLLVTPIRETMIMTGVLDIGIGILLLIGIWPLLTWLGGVLGALHMLTVIAAVGIDPITVRDIAILGATLALAIWTWPSWFPWSRPEGETRMFGPPRFS
jgi:uncharacterized membrane protein YphA (DoxX/SURF4 family)